MNKTKLAFWTTNIFGKKNICRLQSFLKYIISFKNSYSNSLPIPKTCTKRCVFMIDGKTTHGGLSDRLRGLFSIYYYCKQNDIEFRIHFKKENEKISEYQLDKLTKKEIKKIKDEINIYKQLLLDYLNNKLMIKQ